MTDKSATAFRTISEVAEDLNVPQHVLRFWESKFSVIKPLKRGGNRRYYRPEDLQLLRMINRLLYTDGYTIRGVQKLLREQGPAQLMAQHGYKVDDTHKPQDNAAITTHNEPVLDLTEQVAESAHDPLAPQLAPQAFPLASPAKTRFDQPPEIDIKAVLRELRVLRSVLADVVQTSGV